MKELCIMIKILKKKSTKIDEKNDRKKRCEQRVFPTTIST
jgi:hypothetical protein